MSPVRRFHSRAGRPHALATATASALFALAGSAAAQSASPLTPSSATRALDALASGLVRELPALSDAVRRPHGRVAAVENCNDSGPGSLRQAILDATGDTTFDLATLACSHITLGSGELTIGTEGSITLDGGLSVVDGQLRPRFTLTANQRSRAINRTGTGQLTLRGMHVELGRTYDGKGGCIAAEGAVLLLASSVTACRSEARGGHAAIGGGVWSADSVGLIASTVSGNLAQASLPGYAFPGGYAYGGGVFAAGGVQMAFSSVLDNRTTGYGYGGGAAGTGGTFVVVNSTIAGNHAFSQAGLGIFGDADGEPDDLRIANSTIFANEASGTIGGVGCRGELAVSNSTIAGNIAARATEGVGIALHGAHALALESSIVTGNGDIDIGGATSISGGHDFVGSSTAPLPPGTFGGDPRFGDFGDHGGLVPTLALLPDSSAIDTGSNHRVVGCDGRGADYDDDIGIAHVYPRVVGAAADIGAYESNAEDVVFGDGFQESGACGT